MPHLPLSDVQTGLMPRRQSCDRCHEQKVRCFTNEKDCVKSENDYLDAGISQSGRYISPHPCTRCKRAKATCIYSPQQRSGRPRLPRDTSTPIRKRARGVSRRSSSSTCTSRSPNASPTSSPSVASTNPSITSDASGWAQYHLNQQQHVESQLHPLHTDMTLLNSPDSCYYPDNRDLQRHEHITFSEWLPFKSANAGFPAPESQSSPYTTPTSADGPAITPLILLRSNASYTHTKAESSPEATWSFDVQPKSYPEQLADINVDIYRAVAGLSNLSSLPLLSYLPSINGIFDASAALAELVEAYNAEQITTPSSVDEHHAASVPALAGAYPSAFDFNTTSAAALSFQGTMDASICPMIYSCYQGLMSALEDICSLFLVWLSELNQSPNMMFIPQSETVTQVANMTTVLSHLLQRLEQGMRSVDLGFGAVVPSSPQPTEYHQMGGVADTGALAQAPVPLLSDSTSGRIGYLLHGHEYHYSPGQEMDGAMGTSVFDMMEQTQERIKSQVRVIKRWLRKSGDMA